MICGIVGSEEAKFTPETKGMALDIIWQILSRPEVEVYCSGHCHLGGIDIWTEDIGDALGLVPLIFSPDNLSWSEGYKPRNLEIAAAIDEIHVITVRELPPDYNGMRFQYCYHCHTDGHIKSGGCWTAWQAKRMGKQAFWHIV